MIVRDKDSCSLTKRIAGQACLFKCRSDQLQLRPVSAVSLLAEELKWNNAGNAPHRQIMDAS
jgi:hypothetical protein